MLTSVGPLDAKAEGVLAVSQKHHPRNPTAMFSLVFEQPEVFRCFLLTGCGLDSGYDGVCKLAFRFVAPACSQHLTGMIMHDTKVCACRLMKP